VQINISARHGHLSSANQQMLAEKAEKVQRFHERINSISVTCDLKQHENPTVEVLVTVEHAGDFVAAVAGDNLLVALDGALHKIEQQLRKHKEKMTGHRVAGLKHLAAEGDTDKNP
jgi:putative sigma-54 modulation protein